MPIFGVDRQTLTAKAISNSLLRQFVTDSVAGSVKNLSYIDDEFTIAKVLGKKLAVDSVNMDFIVYEGDAAGRDSVMDALQNGTSLEQVAPDARSCRCPRRYLAAVCFGPGRRNKRTAFLTHLPVISILTVRLQVRV